MAADYSFEVKNIEMWVPAFFMHNNLEKMSIQQMFSQIHIFKWKKGKFKWFKTLKIDFEGQILALSDSIVTSYGNWLEFFVKTYFFVRFSEFDATIIYDGMCIEWQTTFSREDQPTN